MSEAKKGVGLFHISLLSPWQRSSLVLLRLLLLQVLHEVIYDALSEMDPVLFELLLHPSPSSTSNAATAVASLDMVTVSNVPVPWNDVEVLQMEMLAGPASKSRDKLLHIVGYLTAHEALGTHFCCLSVCCVCALVSCGFGCVLVSAAPVVSCSQADEPCGDRGGAIALCCLCLLTVNDFADISSLLAFSCVLNR